jgi:hypothetical protein
VRGRGSEIKQANIFTYIRSVVGKKNEIQNEINERIRKASKFYHLIKSILWNRDIESVKPQHTKHTLRGHYYMECRNGHSLRQKKAKYPQLRRNSWGQ